MFNLDIAEQFGYHYAQTSRFSREEMQVFATETRNRVDTTLLDGCYSSAIAALPERPVLAESLAYGIEISDHPEVLEVLGMWRICLSSTVEPSDIAERPEEMPVESRQVAFGLETAVEWDAPPASDEEKAIAVADARCRSSSGYTEVLYETEWAEQERVVDEWSDQLLADRVAHVEIEEAARAVIERLGADG